MIATLTASMYIVSIADETYNNKTVQKGSAISRINAEDAYQLYKFTAYTSENNLIEGDNTSSEITQQLQENWVYQISGKFTPLKDNFSSITTNHAQSMLYITSKPYLSKN